MAQIHLQQCGITYLVRKLSLPRRLYPQNVCPQPNLLPNFISGHGLGRNRGGYVSQELGVEPARQSARSSYVNDECCSRQSVENHTRQLLDSLQNTALLL